MQQLAPICIFAMTAILAGSAPAPSLAQDFPNKPIRLIVATAPGGLVDAVARILGESLNKSLGQRVVIENRSGAGGNTGAEAVAKSYPDGYTLGFVQIGNVAINPHVYTDMTFDPLVDLVPVAPVTSSAILVVANAKVPANSLADLIALAKKQPGKLSYGSGGNGTPPHLAGEMFKAAAGIDILHIPYRGTGPAVSDTIGGHVQLTFVGLGAARSGVDSGTLKVLAVAQSQRLKSAPQFPTSAEAGLPGYEFVSWFGVVAPKGTPAPVINTLVKHIHAMQDDPAVQQRMAAGGLEPLKETSEQFGARMRRDQDRFLGIVKAAKLKPE
jgi:tripartite-type tricarboxylate transporter receptor subunit TctC